MATTFNNGRGVYTQNYSRPVYNHAPAWNTISMASQWERIVKRQIPEKEDNLRSLVQAHESVQNLSLRQRINYLLMSIAFVGLAIAEYHYTMPLYTELAGTAASAVWIWSGLVFMSLICGIAVIEPSLFLPVRENVELNSYLAHLEQKTNWPLILRIGGVFLALVCMISIYSISQHRDSLIIEQMKARDPEFIDTRKEFVKFWSTAFPALLFLFQMIAGGFLISSLVFLVFSSKVTSWNRQLENLTARANRLRDRIISTWAAYVTGLNAFNRRYNLNELAVPPNEPLQEILSDYTGVRNRVQQRRLNVNPVVPDEHATADTVEEEPEIVNSRPGNSTRRDSNQTANNNQSAQTSASQASTEEYQQVDADFDEVIDVNTDQAEL